MPFNPLTLAMFMAKPLYAGDGAGRGDRSQNPPPRSRCFPRPRRFCRWAWTATSIPARFKRRRVRLQLDRPERRPPRPPPMRLKHPLSISGQTPSKVTFLRRAAEAERVRADIAHARRNGDFAQAMSQLMKVHPVDDSQALGQGDARQVFAPRDGVAPQLKHGFRQRQRGDRLRAEHADADHVHRVAVDLGGRR